MKKLLIALISIIFGVILASNAFAKVTYYHINNVGSPIVATDEGANVIWTKVYSPFGEESIRGCG